MRNIFGGGAGLAKIVQNMQSTSVSILVHEDILFLSLFELVSEGTVGPNGKTSFFLIFLSGGEGHLKDVDWSAHWW